MEAMAAAAARSFAVGRDWIAAPAMRHLDERFDAAGNEPDQVADAAEALLRDADWVQRLLAPLLPELLAEPWFEPPLRASRDAMRTGVVLYSHPTVAITASVTDAATLRRQPPARTVVAAGRLSVAHYVRGGDAVVRRWHAPAADGDFTGDAAGPCQPLSPIALFDGLTLRSDGRDTATLIDRAVSDVVAITATVRIGAAQMMREFDRATGAPLRAATLDDGASRSQLLLGLLRLASPGQAAPGYEAATRDPAFFLRWQAVREWLARDARAAAPRLAEMAASDPNAEVRAAARATLPLLERRAA